MAKCPSCGSEHVQGWGHKRGAHRLKCQDCGRQFFAEALSKRKDTAALEEIGRRYTPDELAQLARPRHTFPPATLDFSGEELCIGVMSDTHIGSAYTNEQDIVSAIAEFHRQGVNCIVHAGDVTEGMSGRDGHVYELAHVGYSAQRKAAIRLLSLVEDIPLYLIDGNHDRWFKIRGNIGACMVEDITDAIPSAKYIGSDEGDLSVAGISIRLWHGEDASSYAVSYRVQKIVESFTGGEKPNVLICGHTHKALYIPERNVHCVSAGCLQGQSKWMRGKRIAAHKGFWILRLVIGDGEVRRFGQEFIPLYR